MRCEFLGYHLHGMALNPGILFSARPYYVLLHWAFSHFSFCHHKALREHRGFPMPPARCHLCHSWPRRCSRVEAWLSQLSPGWISSLARAPRAGDVGTFHIHEWVSRLLEEAQGCPVAHSWALLAWTLQLFGGAESDHSPDFGEFLGRREGCSSRSLHTFSLTPSQTRSIFIFIPRQVWPW